MIKAQLATSSHSTMLDKLKNHEFDWLLLPGDLVRVATNSNALRLSYTIGRSSAPVAEKCRGGERPGIFANGTGVAKRWRTKLSWGLYTTSMGWGAAIANFVMTGALRPVSRLKSTLAGRARSDLNGSDSTNSTLLMTAAEMLLPLAGRSLPVVFPMGSAPRTLRLSAHAPG